MEFDDDDDEYYSSYNKSPKSLNKGAAQAMLEWKGVNEQTLTKRFNEIVAIQSATKEAQIFVANCEKNRFLRYVENEKIKQNNFQKCVGILTGVKSDRQKFGYFETKARIETNLDGLDRAFENNSINEESREQLLIEKKVYSALYKLGSNSFDKTLDKWIDHYSQMVKNCGEDIEDWQGKADELQVTIDELKQNISSNAAQKSDSKKLAEEFESDYRRFVLAYPESEFVSKMKHMVKDAYGQDRYVGADTLLDMANKIAYGSVTNVFVDGRKSDGEGR